MGAAAVMEDKCATAAMVCSHGRCLAGQSELACQSAAVADVASQLRCGSESAAVKRSATSSATDASGGNGVGMQRLSSSSSSPHMSAQPGENDPHSDDERLLKLRKHPLFHDLQVALLQECLGAPRFPATLLCVLPDDATSGGDGGSLSARPYQTVSRSVVSAHVRVEREMACIRAWADEEGQALERSYRNAVAAAECERYTALLYNCHSEECKRCINSYYDGERLSLSRRVQHHLSRRRRDIGLTGTCPSSADAGGARCGQLPLRELCCRDSGSPQAGAESVLTTVSNCDASMHSSKIPSGGLTDANDSVGLSASTELVSKTAEPVGGPLIATCNSIEAVQASDSQLSSSSRQLAQSTVSLEGTPKTCPGEVPLDLSFRTSTATAQTVSDISAPASIPLHVIDSSSIAAMPDSDRHQRHKWGHSVGEEWSIETSRTKRKMDGTARANEARSAFYQTEKVKAAHMMPILPGKDGGMKKRLLTKYSWERQGCIPQALEEEGNYRPNSSAALLQEKVCTAASGPHADCAQSLCVPDAVLSSSTTRLNRSRATLDDVVEQCLSGQRQRKRRPTQLRRKGPGYCWTLKSGVSSANTASFSVSCLKKAATASAACDETTTALCAVKREPDASAYAASAVGRGSGRYLNLVSSWPGQDETDAVGATSASVLESLRRVVNSVAAATTNGDEKAAIRRQPASRRGSATILGEPTSRTIGGCCHQSSVSAPQPVEAAVGVRLQRDSGDDVAGNGQPAGKRYLSHQARLILNDWFMKHIRRPYPTLSEKILLAQQCGISSAKVDTWFANKRNRTHNTRKLLPKYSRLVLLKSAAAATAAPAVHASQN